MSIEATDLKYYLTGAASDGATQTDPNASLGNFRSSSEIASGLPNNLWDDVQVTEAQSGDTEYRSMIFKNLHATITLQDIKVWITEETAGQDEIDIALEEIPKYNIKATQSAGVAYVDIDESIPVGTPATGTVMVIESTTGVEESLAYTSWATDRFTLSGVTANAYDVLDGVEVPYIQTIVNESTAPSGPTFTHPTSKATGLAPVNLRPGGMFGIWERRVVPASCEAYTNNTNTVRIEGTTS